MAKHALLGASSAARWLNCTPSARLTEKIEDTISEYAAEGTLAHSIGEMLLRIELGGNDGADVAEFEEFLKETRNNKLYYEGMVDEVEDYTGYVMEQYNAALAKTKDAKIFLEEKLDYSTYVPSGFGTGDCIIIADGEMEIIDLKFGKGVEVSPVDNPQLKLYALGAYEKYSFIYGIEKIKMTIAQVRLNNISSSDISAEMLEEWAENVVKPKAKLAYAGKGEQVPGEWCTFCKVKATCSARATANIAFYSAHSDRDKKLLDIVEIAEILGMANELKKWADDIQAYALETALEGTKYPGWKLVEGRSNRKITDEDALATKLMAEGYKENKIYKPKTLEGITALEKVVGKKKFAELAAGLIDKPPGKPTLVSEDDNRPELDSIETEFDFIN
jgi:hypothetical protein